MDWKSIHDIAEEILYTNEDEDDNDNDDKNTTSRCDSNNTMGEADTRTQQPTYYWTPTEYQELLRGIELYGMESTNKLATLLPGRSESAILNYCRRNSVHLPPTTTRDTAQQLLHDRGLLRRSHTDTATTTAAAAAAAAATLYSLLLLLHRRWSSHARKISGGGARSMAAGPAAREHD